MVDECNEDFCVAEGENTTFEYFVSRSYTKLSTRHD
jgi:hypothetical protein